MSEATDIINFVRDTITSISIPVHKFSSPSSTHGTERIILNYLPATQFRAGTMKHRNGVVNINVMIPKINGSTNSTRIDEIEKALETNIEASNNANTSRVKYHYLDKQSGTVVNEDDKEIMLNVRVEATFT